MIGDYRFSEASAQSMSLFSGALIDAVKSYSALNE
jgi:hypothetical protein